MCDASTKVLGTIEIDDPSHGEPDRIACDLVKDILFASANIPLLRIENSVINDTFASLPEKQRATFAKNLREARARWSERKSRL
ncbi:DUF2726 domain-containing protein [Massilia genomosp. 1]|uniref:DUF2726 domain-containing protein n=1 Tax=Massilia genomosp. 1 TaxID=2609280 RepID=UPI0035A2F385